jgi:hypothetical protein
MRRPACLDPALADRDIGAMRSVGRDGLTTTAPYRGVCGDRAR